MGWGLGLIIGSLRYFITCMRKKETLLLFPPVYSLKVKVAYENRKLSEKLKEKENSSGRTAKCFYSLLSWLQATIFFLHEFISMFPIVRCILRSLFHLEVLLQEQTLAFLMSGVSMAGRISLLGWILQINIVEMFWINVSIIPYCPNSLSIWSIESHNNRVYFEKPMICHIILRGWLQTWRMFITST